MMIDMSKLQGVLFLHEKTFVLLRWVGSQLQRGSLDLSHVHTSMGIGEAAEDWIRRNLDNLPCEVRPSQEELAPFARLFASYLRTSFEIGKKHLSSSCGCYCSFCAYVRNCAALEGPHSVQESV